MSDTHTHSLAGSPGGRISRLRGWRCGLRAPVAAAFVALLSVVSTTAPVAAQAGSGAATAPGVAQTGTAAARGATSSRADLAARADSLLLEYERRRAELLAFDSVHDAASRRIDVDTTPAGPFLIVERASVDVSRVAAEFEVVWREYEALVGDEHDRLRGTVVTLRLPERFFAGSGKEPFRFHPFATGHSDFRSTADRIVRGALTRALPADVKAWLAGETLRLHGGLDWAYRDLATSGSHAGRSCFQRDISACIAALGLIEPGADWSRWYTPQQIRQLIALGPRAPSRSSPRSERWCGKSPPGHRCTACTRWPDSRRTR
jgi:hypothetical protein